MAKGKGCQRTGATPKGKKKCNKCDTTSEAGTDPPMVLDNYLHALHISTTLLLKTLREQSLRFRMMR